MFLSKYTRGDMVPSGHTPKLVSTFDDTKGDIIELIEIDGISTSRRREVTEEYVRVHISQDFRQTNPDDASTESLKLFFSTRQGEYDGKMIPIPISQALFEEITPFARISDIYRDVVTRKTAMHVYSTPQMPGKSMPVSAETVRKQYLNFIFQVTTGRSAGISTSASFTYDFASRNMYVFMHCLVTPECAKFCDAIEEGATLLTPFRVPGLIIQYNLESRLHFLDTYHDHIYEFEKDLNMRYGVTMKSEFELLEVDFERLSKGINAATTNLAYIVWSCKTTARQIVFLENVIGRYRVQALQNGLLEQDVNEVSITVLENLAHLRCWNESLEERAEYLSKRGQAMVPTVYSGIAQRDAALSQNAAIAAARDSSVMRVIAAITIIFLPATTTATFFSTSFFDFKVGRHERVYSWWLWLYWVTTIALTAVVVLGAVNWWRKKEEEIARRLRKGKAPQ